MTTINNPTISEDGLWAWNGTEWVSTGSQGAETPPGMQPGNQPPKKNRRGLKIAAGVAAVLAIAAIATGGSDSDGTTETPQQTAESEVEAAPPAEEAAPAPAADEGAPGIGDPVSDGKFEFTVTGVESGVEQVGDEYFNETAQGSYTLVTMTVTNTGDEPQTFFADNVEGTDSQGRELAADSMASVYATENGADTWMTEINPGNSITVTVAFDVADGETLQSIIVHDSAFSGGEAIVLK